MTRTVITVLVASAAAAAAASTLATGQTASVYALPEPKVTSAQVLKLTTRPTGSCSRRRITLLVLTPPGLGYIRLQIRVGSSTVATMIGGIGALNASLALPTSRARVTVSAITKGGVALTAGRTYSRCAKPAARRPSPSRPPRPATPIVEEGRNPPPVIFEGGGED